MIFIDQKYKINENTSIFDHPIVIKEKEHLKQISDEISFGAVSVSSDHKPIAIEISIRCKGTKRIIQELQKIGYIPTHKEKITPNPYTFSGLSDKAYYIQRLRKNIQYVKWAIYRTDHGLSAQKYIDDINELDEYPYIDPSVLPVTVNRMGGYFPFREEGGEDFIKIIEIQKEEKPLTLEEMYPKNNDNFHYGWISPNGDTYTCGFEDHYICAEAIVEKLWPDKYISDGERELEERGWIKISRPVPYNLSNMNEQAVYFGSFSKKITKAQVDMLYRLGLDQEWNVVGKLEIDGYLGT